MNPLGRRRFRVGALYGEEIDVGCRVTPGDPSNGFLYEGI